MTRSEKLKPVVNHVEKREQAALEAVAFSQQQLHAQQSKLQQLIEYKEEYAAGSLSASSGTVSAIQLQEYNRFFSQLSDTIEQQQQVVSMAQRELDIKREKWMQTRTRSDAMHKVMDKMQQGEMKLAEQQEQKQMDEVALRISLKNS